MTRGEKVKYVRTLRGVTQTELSKLTGLSASYISEVENEKSEMSVKSLEKIAKALNVDAAFFLDGHAVAIDELCKVSDYELPSDIAQFITKPENLGYIKLAKKLRDEQIPLSIFEMLINNYKLAVEGKLFI